MVLSKIWESIMSVLEGTAIRSSKISEFVKAKKSCERWGIVSYLLTLLMVAILAFGHLSFGYALVAVVGASKLLLFIACIVGAIGYEILEKSHKD
jgi:hypothetical protein